MLSLAVPIVGVLVAYIPWASATVAANKTSFWVIADVPYSVRDRVILNRQMQILESNVDFLVHLGDLKSKRTACGANVLAQMDTLLKQSPVPVFIIVGDNEFNDCTGIAPSVALNLWRKTFARFDVKYWNHDFNVKQLPNRPEVFSFVNKQTLFIGLNVIGGSVHDKHEWDVRHADQVAWVKTVMNEKKNDIHSVVLFGHTDPGRKHTSFFVPLTTFLNEEFPHDIPVLYICGDAHEWAYNPGFFGVDNWLRVRLTGGVTEPVVKVTVDPVGLGASPVKAFKVERFL
jgi:predicted phosphodiesterase